MRRPTLLLLLGLAAGCASLQTDRLVPAERGTAPAPPLAERWTRNVDAASGPAAPQVFEGVVFVATRKGDLVAVDAASGRVRGRGAFGQSIEGAFATSPAGDVAYVPLAKPGQIIAHSLRDGRRLWRWRAEARDATADAGLVLAGDVVVAPLGNGTVVGLDRASGTARWRIRPDTLARFVAAPVALPGGAVAVADDRGTVRALAPGTGEVLWTRAVGAPVAHTPAVGAAAAALLVPTTRGALVALDVRTGAERWRAELGQDDRVVPRVATPGVGEELAVVGATNGRLVAIDVVSGAERWARTFDDHVNGAPLVADGRVYLGTTGERMLVLSAATGETLWETTVRGRVKSAVAGADGVVYVLTEPRHLIAFEPASL